jgi:hypothetical protein
LELALSQEVYEYLEELDQMNWSARGNVLNQYLRNTSIGTTVTGDHIPGDGFNKIKQEINCETSCYYLCIALFIYFTNYPLLNIC